MACSSPHTVEQINDSVEKLIQENTIRQEKIVELAEEFSKELSAKGDMQKAYKECKDIPPEKLVATDVFLKKKKKVQKITIFIMICINSRAKFKATSVPKFVRCIKETRITIVFFFIVYFF